MYPLKLKPIYDRTIWGNDRLTKMRGRKETGLGTSWEISAHPHAKNVIVNGSYQGKTLWELLEERREDLLGTIPRERMLRLAFLDAKEDLSVQVHPYDSYAHLHEQDEGKTEAWYILKANKGAKLAAGTLCDDEQKIKEALKDKKIASLIRYHEVQEGDFVCIDAGMLHALGKGITALEIGENSNTTYRFYDYDRVDASGRKRELHLKKSFDVADFSLVCKPVHSLPKAITQTREKLLVEREEFCVKLVDVCGTYTLPQDGKRFFIISNVKEDALLCWGEEEEMLSYTESVFLPAACPPVTLKGTTRILLSYVKTEQELLQEAECAQKKNG